MGKGASNAQEETGADGAAQGNELDMAGFQAGRSRLALRSELVIDRTIPTGDVAIALGRREVAIQIRALGDSNLVPRPRLRLRVQRKPFFMINRLPRTGLPRAILLRFFTHLDRRCRNLFVNCRLKRNECCEGRRAENSW